MRPGPTSPVVALDIDGTSGDYHGHYIRFAEQWLGKELPSATAYTGGVPFHRYLGISRATYRTIKLAYRQGGMKRSMPPYEGIGEFSRHIRRQGVQVWICTTRPYLHLNNIDPDTRHWLRHRAHIQYDGILYGPHKYRDLVKCVGRERVVCAYDDLPEQVGVAVGLGLHACLRTQPYNVGWEPTASSGSWCRVGSVADMRSEFDRALDKWRQNNG